MAIDLMSRIPDREDLDTYEKIVLMIMADRADEEGLLWYANETIARKCSMTKRGVQKVLDRLITRLIVRKMHRHDRSNFYIINVDRLPRMERPAKPSKEVGPMDYLADEEEADLFADRGEHGSSRGKSRGERGSIRGEPGSVRGEPGSPDSLTDPTMIRNLYAREIADHFAQQWNLRLAVFPKIAQIEITDRRWSKLHARLTDRGIKDGDTPAAKSLVDELIGKIEGSPFLCGEVKEWAISVDWVLGPENFDKTMDRLNERNTGPTGNGRSNLDAAARAAELLASRRGSTGSGGRRAAG